MVSNPHRVSLLGPSLPLDPVFVFNPAEIHRIQWWYAPGNDGRIQSSKMTGASFAQYFPSAPRAAKDRAMERERAKIKPGDSATTHPSSDYPAPPTLSAAVVDAALAPVPTRSSPASSASSFSRSSGIPPSSYSRLGAKEQVNDEPTASTRLSHNSYFAHAGSSMLPKTSAALSHLDQLTPPNSEESPSHSTSGSRTADQVPFTSAMLPMQILNGTLPTPCPAERAPIRNPALRVKGQKCTYDPFLDSSLGSQSKRKAKPTYKDIRLVCTYSTCPLRRGERRQTIDHG